MLQINLILIFTTTPRGRYYRFPTLLRLTFSANTINNGNIIIISLCYKMQSLTMLKMDDYISFYIIRLVRLIPPLLNNSPLVFFGMMRSARDVLSTQVDCAL